MVWVLSGTQPLSKRVLTHWGQVTHIHDICVDILIIIGSDNGLAPGWRQAIIWTNDGIMLIGTLGINLNEISSEIYTFSFKKMHLKMSYRKWPFCLSLNVLAMIHASLGARPPAVISTVPVSVRCRNNNSHKKVLSFPEFRWLILAPYTVNVWLSWNDIKC